MMVNHTVVANSGQRVTVKPGTNNSIELSIQTADRIHSITATLDINSASIVAQALGVEAEREQQEIFEFNKLRRALFLPKLPDSLELGLIKRDEKIATEKGGR